MPAAPSRTMFAEALGGTRGLIDSGLPTLVFVIAHLVSGTRVSVLMALAAGLCVAGLRLARHEPLQQVVSGMFGLALAAYLAVRLNGGDGTGFFLPGVVVSGAYALAFAVSVAVRRPLTGVLVAAVAGTGSRWRDDRAVLRAHRVVSLGWVTLYAAKAAVQGYLLATGHGTTELGIVRLAMGYPLLLAGLAVSAAYLRSKGALSADAPAATPSPTDAPLTTDAPLPKQ